MKTTVCKELKKRFVNRVFLDGDWCWDMEPFSVTVASFLERLKLDIDCGIREEGVMKRSCERLPMYSELNTVKIDVSGKTVEETAEAIHNSV